VGTQTCEQSRCAHIHERQLCQDQIVGVGRCKNDACFAVCDLMEIHSCSRHQRLQSLGHRPIGERCKDSFYSRHGQQMDRRRYPTIPILGYRRERGYGAIHTPTGRQKMRGGPSVGQASGVLLSGALCYRSPRERTDVLG
jgi:hypothetical protein